MGIIERIKTASTVEALTGLMKELDTYKYASRRTVRKANRVAFRVRQTLG